MGLETEPKMKSIWVYLVQDLEAIEEVGKGDFGNGLNMLGMRGWCLVLHDGDEYIFKYKKQVRA